MESKKKGVNRKRNALFLIIAGLILTVLGVFFSFYLIPKSESDDSIILERNKIPTPRDKEFEKIDLNSLFQYRNISKRLAESKIADNQQIRLMATGDVIPARSVNFRTVREKDFRYPYLKTAQLLNTADIVFINLESPLIKNCPETVEGMIFCGDVHNIEGLKFANVNVANLANNHLTNYGKEGIDNTVRLLKENGIAVTGLGEPAIITVKGKKFGFLGYNDIDRFEGIANADEPKIGGDIASLKNIVDYVVVAFHWGIEYVSGPTNRQRTLARLAIDSGADLIIGNHPHWVQGVEIYNNKFIAYAHGNFVFDQMWSRETREGVVGEYIFGESGLQDVSYFPIIIDDYAQPRFAGEKEAGIILKRMEESSRQIKIETTQ